ncbi:MAG: helix-turn-helix transcriptional regulator [Spirochaetia bacterium]
MERGVGGPGSTTDREQEPCGVRPIALDEITLCALSLPTEPASWPSCFTPAEIDIARRLIRGDSRASIARDRAVSINTIAAQIQTMLDKLEVESASALVAEIACRNR